MRPDAKLLTERRTKVHFQYRGKLNLLLGDLQKMDIEKTNWHNGGFKKNKVWNFFPESIDHQKKVSIELCWLLDISTQTLINRLNLGQWNI